MATQDAARYMKAGGRCRHLGLDGPDQIGFRAVFDGFAVILNPAVDL
ncbi:MAG: hypothetical protein WAS73_11130 [Defluviicoccus sp.]